jgi:hypothetical protein
VALVPKVAPQHSDEAAGNVLQQFKGKAKLEALLRLLADQVQAHEDALHEIPAEGIVIDVAVGAQLDGIGSIVGQPRNGQNDVTYRLFIKAKVLVNTSGGTIEDIVEVFDLLTGLGMTIQLTESFATDPAHFDVFLTPALPTGVDGVVVSGLAFRAKGASIRGISVFFDEFGIAFDEPLEGFDDADDAFGTAVGA